MTTPQYPFQGSASTDPLGSEQTTSLLVVLIVAYRLQRNGEPVVRFSGHNKKQQCYLALLLWWTRTDSNP